MRATRYLTARRCPTPGAIVTAAIPNFAGESITGIRGRVSAKSLPSVGNAFEFIGPNGLLEWNFYVMTVPYEVISTYHGGGASAIPSMPATTSQLDILFRRLVLEFGADGNEFYGANPDGAGVSYDAVQNVFVRQRGTGDDAADNTQDSSKVTDEPLATMGPRGIERLFSHESILHSDSIASLGKGISGLASIFTNAQINDLTYSDQVDISIPVYMSNPGYVLMGAVRYDVSETEEFASIYTAPDNPVKAPQEARNRALSMLFGGDRERVQWLVTNGTDATSNYVRSLLFGGDNYLEDAGAYTPIDFFDTGSWYRKNELVVASKLFVGHESPYVMRVV